MRGEVRREMVGEGAYISPRANLIAILLTSKLHFIYNRKLIKVVKKKQNER